MYVHGAVREILTLSRKHSRHRYQLHLVLICCSIVFLVIWSLRHVPLRSALDEVGEDISPALGVEDYETNLTEEETAVLSRSFRSADFDNDKTLTETEISMAINRETKQHILQAMRNNFKVFFSLDKLHKNGQVDWEEYYQHYMKDRLGLTVDEIARITKNPASSDVSRDVKESLANMKAAWSEAARTNPDAVNIDEFLGLQHPESSHSLLTQRVEEMMEKFDDDNDGKLTKSEYVTDPYRELDKDDINLRGKEFDLVLDRNKDGIADKREIITFLDPKNPHWARYEAINLMSLADRNSDNRLDIEEVLSKPDLFLFSKFVNADVGFHGEF